ncbi:hypothetical protein ABTJ98_20140, partial [Acinetobacter baumannii]
IPRLQRRELRRSDGLGPRLVERLVPGQHRVEQLDGEEARGKSGTFGAYRCRLRRRTLGSAAIA